MPARQTARQTVRQTAPGTLRRDARPPIPPDSAPSPGAVGPLPLRPTARQRPTISPAVWDTGPVLGVPVVHPYVRRFWTAVIGPGAVADLLRLATAATRGRSLLRPIHLATLVTHQLVDASDGALRVRTTIPLLDSRLRSRLPPSLQREHRRLVG